MMERHPAALPQAPAFDPEATWSWIRRNVSEPAHRPMMKFAGWLWTSGIHDMPILLAILDDCRLRKPKLPYAYYAPNSEARTGIEARINIARAESENNQIKADERQWLARC